MNILLISSALPRNTTAGELILYRHFSQLPELKLAVVTDNLQDIATQEYLDIRINKTLERLTRTRISRWSHDICQCISPLFNLKELRKYISCQTFDLIFTVAEGTHWLAAQQMAKEFNIPLVTVFHDWWPDLAYIHPWAKGVLENRFKQLYRNSTLALCVSEEMRQALGEHPNSEVIYPIPAQFSLHKKIHSLSTDKPFKLVYSGKLSGVYSATIQSLITSLQSSKEVELKLFGPLPDWSEPFLKCIQEQEIYGGFLSRDLLHEELSNASALLVVLPFVDKNNKWLETSFPSKLVEYCNFGRPIIIWGPEYCPAVRWGLKYKAALVVTSPSVQDLVKAINDLAIKPEEQTRLEENALKMAQEMFNPENIQHQFMKSICKVAV